MTPGERRTAILFAVAFGGFLAWTGWEVRQMRAFTQRQQLPDGSMIELRAVTFGQEHRCSLGSSAQRILRKVLPERLGRWIGGVEITQDAFPETLMFWLLHTRHRGNLFSELSTQAVELNERGEAGQFGGWPANLRRKTDELKGVEFTVFDRRSPTVGLRLFQRLAGRWQRVAEFRVPNPAHGKFPTWQPESFPVTRTNHDLAVTLNGLETGPASRSDSRSGAPRFALVTFRREGDLAANRGMTQSDQETIRLRLRCQAVAGAISTNRWSLREVYFLDATGNQRGGPLAQPLGLQSESVEVTFRGGFNPHETVWKVRLGFCGLAGTLLQQDEVCRLRDLPVSLFVGQKGTDVPLRRHDTKLQVVVNSTQLYWWAGLSPWPTNLSLSLLEARIDRIPLQTIRYSNLPVADMFRRYYPDALFFEPLTIATNAKTIDLTFAVHETQYFEFVVHPTLTVTSRFLLQP